MPEDKIGQPQRLEPADLEAGRQEDAQLEERCACANLGLSSVIPELPSVGCVAGNGLCPDMIQLTLWRAVHDKKFWDMSVEVLVEGQGLDVVPDDETLPIS